MQDGPKGFEATGPIDVPPPQSIGMNRHERRMHERQERAAETRRKIREAIKGERVNRRIADRARRKVA